MLKVHYIVALTAFLLGSALPAEAQPKLKQIFGITSTTDYLNQLIVLNQMQNTLAEIQDTNAKIVKEEKNIASFTKLINEELQKDIKQAQEQLAVLANDVLNQSELRTKDLQTRIERREGNVEDLQKALKGESFYTKWAKTANTLALGKLGFAVNVTQRMNDANKKALEDEVAARRKSIADLQKQLGAQQKMLTNILTSPEYQQKAQELNTKITEYTKALGNILNAAAKLRQERIFGPYNEKAEQLLKQLNTQVKEAKCTLMKTTSEAKAPIIEKCKQQKLDGAKKAMTGKFPACDGLAITSTVAQINQCISDYRTNRK